MRKILIITMALVLLLSMSVYADNVKIAINGVEQNFASDSRPFLDSQNRTQVPVRFIAESLGFKVDWNGAEKKVSISGNNSNVSLVINSNQINSNGRVTTMDTAAQIQNGRTFVPIRFIVEALGMTVGWNEATKMVNIQSSTPQKTQEQLMSINPKLKENPIDFEDGNWKERNIEINVVEFYSGGRKVDITNECEIVMSLGNRLESFIAESGAKIVKKDGKVFFSINKYSINKSYEVKIVCRGQEYFLFPRVMSQMESFTDNMRNGVKLDYTNDVPDENRIFKK